MGDDSLATASERRARVLADLKKWRQAELLALLEHDKEAPVWTQLLHFAAWYKGGVDAYLANGTRLYKELLGDQAEVLKGAAADKTDAPAETGDVWDDWVPAVPASIDGEPAEGAALESQFFADLEAHGLANVDKLALVIVAGGLGERLGYQGIKLTLPIETLTRTSYLEAYVEHVRALEADYLDKYGQETRIPIAIMTSDSTHSATLGFLEQHKFFGLPEGQLTLIKQEKVPCLDVAVDAEDAESLRLRLVLGSGGRELIMKPHGHGDVHSLLHSSGLARTWAAQGKAYVHFIQDTNFLILNSVLPLLGASLKHNWAFTFTTVARKAKDASGGIVRFVEPGSNGRSVLFNVEYHELDQFLRTRAKDEFPDGDVNNPATGFSPFPGNINHMAIALDPYVRVLDESFGFVPEVFNPKFAAGANKRAFKSPARLECMMQDYPKLLLQFASASTESVNSATGLVLFPSTLVYSPCKNDAASASTKVKDDVPPQCASSAEHDLFAVNRQRLRAAGISLPTGDAKKTEWLGIPVDTSGPQIVLDGGFATAQSSIARKFPTPELVSISSRSSLILEGRNIIIRSLHLDGAVRIFACPGAHVDVRSLRVESSGVVYEPVENANGASPVDTMRGYLLKQSGVRELRFDTPGEYIVDEVSQ